MYSGILMSKSRLYKSCHFYQNQNSDMAPPFSPGFAPALPGFGENHYENFRGQPHSALNPAYQEHQMYPMHKTPSQGFGFQQGQMTGNMAFYQKGLSYQYSVQQQVMTYAATQPATQAQPRQVQVERNAQEPVLVVELEPSVFPTVKPRLRWTPELHERFTRAAQELGGYFKATPKAILQKMNVRGMTPCQIKSHLQKVRNRFPRTSTLQEITGLGIQNNTDPQLSEGQHERLFETPNQHTNQRIALGKNPVNSFSFEDFGGGTSSQTSNYRRSAMCDNHAPNQHTNQRIALVKNPVNNFKFEGFGGGTSWQTSNLQTPNQHTNQRIALVKNPVNNFNFEEFGVGTSSQASNYHQNRRSAMFHNHAHKATITLEDSN